MRHELYKAYYCGLCRRDGQDYRAAVPLLPDYDLVFLAMMRQVFEGAGTKLSLRRCPIHPLKKQPVRRDERRAFVCLIRIGDTHGGARSRDDIADRTRRRARGGKA